ncbi:MAG TPA: phage holin family protein [Bacteroidia bacterium]
MQEQTKLEETVENIKEYVNTRYELTVLKTSDKVAHTGSVALSYLPVVFLTVLTVFMLSFALGFYLNTVFHSEYYGFLVVGGGYFVIGLIVLMVRKNLIAKPFRNKIIKELLKNHPIN